ncbi:unnamed protein product [Adineta ricciae]|uniref:Uncharacterized protein n=1 Tax=Adineta ricciae TaxID=249248 RepID=A0A816BRR3_ADIRI|nr:unnamed protein product [Adineta ricciae]CAF1614251.1 unnamed protein product [Adineta ricciae]
MKSKYVQETMKAAERDGEIVPSDEVKAFQLKQSCLCGSENISTTPLDTLPNDIFDKMYKEYEVYLANEIQTCKDQLYQFATMKGRWWPTVDKIYIYGPFKNINSDTTLFNIPGYGDGFEAMTIRANEAAVICDQLVRIIRGDGRDPLTSSFLKGLLQSSTSRKHLCLVVTYYNLVVEENKNAKGNDEEMKKKYRVELKEVANKTL